MAACALLLAMLNAGGETAWDRSGCGVGAAPAGENPAAARAHRIASVRLIRTSTCGFRRRKELPAARCRMSRPQTKRGAPPRAEAEHRASHARDRPPSAPSYLTDRSVRPLVLRPRIAPGVLLSGDVIVCLTAKGRGHRDFRQLPDPWAARQSLHGRAQVSQSAPAPRGRLPMVDPVSSC